MLLLRVVIIFVALLPLALFLYELVYILVLSGTFIFINIIVCYSRGFLMILNNMRREKDYEFCSVGLSVWKRKKMSDDRD